ncbi:YceI family protein [Phenylobacterium sp.]|jgi:polyisoprenoid-binding protein YceI|uniref:YceI family protein n=1 Tax=Phenylobacterium sp. TaxID=1871053 RepID=UPI002F3F1709
MPTLHAAVLGLALAALAGAAPAATTAPAKPPTIVFGLKDPKLAPAGTYKLDDAHAAVIARVSHIGYSVSVFRFDKVAGALKWDPAAPAASSVTATVDTASISSPVPGFAAQLAGAQYLNAKAFPQATFTSTAFRQTDATHGEVDGTLALMGKSKPVTFAVELVGAGPGFGAPRLGMEAKTSIVGADYGLPPQFFAAPIELVIDAEFVRQP